MFPFECNLCVLNFSTRLERNAHTKLHFKQRFCINCNQSLIQIGDEWYELRLHSDEKCCPNIFNDDNIKTEQLNINPFEMLETSVENIEEQNIPAELAPLEEETAANHDSEDESELMGNESDDDLKNESNTSDTNLDSYPINDESEEKAIVDIDGAVNDDEHDNLTVHLREEKSTKPEKQNARYECSDCQTTFTARSSLIRHIRKGHGTTEKISTKQISYNRQKCNLCDKTFATQERTRLHIQIVHEGKKLFKCEICDKCYSSRGSLKTHQIIHSDVRPFICNYCGRGFNSRYGLDEHMHTHTDDRPFLCKICNKTFKQNRLLVAHTRVHTRERPYKCKEEGCDRAYINGIDLKRHRYSKHGIFTKKHTCHICPKIFPEKKMLRKHLESH